MSSSVLVSILSSIANMNTTVVAHNYSVYAPPPGPIIYVDLNATGANDGSSWTDAFTDLQVALAVASAGNEIRVAEGDSIDEGAVLAALRAVARAAQ